MPRPRHRIAPIALCIACLAAPRTMAADWSVSGFLSQRFDADSNIDLDESGSGEAFGSITNLGFVVRARTGRADWTFAPGVRGTRYFGAGASSDLDSIDPRFNGSMALRGDDQRLTASLSVVPENTTFSQFEDSGVVEDNTVQITISGDVGWEYDLDPRNTLALGIFATAEEFTKSTDTLAANRSYGARTSWSHDIDALTASSLAFTVSRFDSDNSDNTRTMSYELRGGLDRTLTQRLSVGFTAGPALTSTTRDRAGGGTQSDFSAGFVGSLDATYQGKDTTLTATAEQIVDQDSVGTVESRLSFGAGAAHRINNWSRISVNSRLGFQNPLFSATTDDSSNRWTLSLAPTYTVSLTPDWGVSLGYVLRTSLESGDAATSNAVFIEISRGLSFLQ